MRDAATEVPANIVNSIEKCELISAGRRLSTNNSLLCLTLQGEENHCFELTEPELDQLLKRIMITDLSKAIDALKQKGDLSSYHIPAALPTSTGKPLRSVSLVDTRKKTFEFTEPALGELLPIVLDRSTLAIEILERENLVTTYHLR